MEETKEDDNNTTSSSTTTSPTSHGTKKDQNDDDFAATKDDPDSTTSATATTITSKRRNKPRSQRVVSFRDHKDEDDIVSKKKKSSPSKHIITPGSSLSPKRPTTRSKSSSNGGYVKVYNLNDDPQISPSTSSTTTASSRKRNRSYLSSSSATSALSIVHARLPVFQSGWRALRYGSPNTSTSSNISMRARFQSARSLNSLLVPQKEDEYEEDSEKDKKRPTIRSDVWKDGRGCRWSLLLFPLGNTTDGHIGLFLVKHSPHMERNVHVEFHLRRFDSRNNLDGRSSSRYPQQHRGRSGGFHYDDTDVNALMAEEEKEESAYVCEFRHLYTAIGDEYDSHDETTAQDWGLNEARPLCDVLRRCIDDDGFLDIRVYIDDILSPSPPSPSRRHSPKPLRHLSPIPASRLRQNGAVYGRKRDGYGVRNNVLSSLKLSRAEKGLTMDENGDGIDDEVAVVEDTDCNDTIYNNGPCSDDDNGGAQVLNYHQYPKESFSKQENMAGLENQGATCYMNSLLQVWFYLPALRRLVLNLPLPLEEEMSDNGDGDDASMDSYGSMIDSFSSSSSLSSNDDNETMGSGNRVDGTTDGFRNDGNNEDNRSENTRQPTAVEIRVGHALQCVFAKLLYASQTSNGRVNNGDCSYSSMSNPVVSTSALTTAFGWDSASLFRQHDVQELSRVLLDKLESVFRAHHRCLTAAPVTPDLFEGKVLSYIRCTSVTYSSSKVEPFLDLQLNVKGCPTLYESLQQFVHEEELKGENQYDASEAGFGKQDAKKGVRIHTLPPVLNIHLKRFEFDMAATMGMIKVHDRLEFPLVMDMTDFLVENEDDHDYDSRNNVYHLHSIVMHSGCVGGGHYTAFIRPKLDSYDFPRDKLSDKIDTSNDKENTRLSDLPPYHDDASEELSPREWFKFDDELVVPVDEEQMLEAAYGTPSTAQDMYSSPVEKSEKHYDASNMSMIGRRSRLSLSSNKIHNPRPNRDCDRGSNGGHAGVRRQSTASAYMLAYIRESDLPWVLSEAGPNCVVVDTIEKEEKNKLLSKEGKSTFSTKNMGLRDIPTALKLKLGMGVGETHVIDQTKQLNSDSKKGKHVPISKYQSHCVTIPFITDKEIAGFDSLEGAYIPQFIRSVSQKSGYVKVLNDFAVWDGHVCSTQSSLMKKEGTCVTNVESGSLCTPHEDSLQRVSLPIEDSGFALLRSIAHRTGVPIHRMRIWGTSRRENGTVRIHKCVTKKDLLESTVRQIVTKYLSWTFRGAVQSEMYRGCSKMCRRRKEKRDMDMWMRNNGSNGFYVEVLPLEWTKYGNVTAKHKLIKPLTYHLECDEFTQDADYPSGKYHENNIEGQTANVSFVTDGADQKESLSLNSIPAKLGIHLPDHEMSVVYDNIVPDVPQGAILLFFKEFSPLLTEICAGDTTSKKTTAGVSQFGSLRFLGSALLLDPSLPLSVLSDCMNLLQKDSSSAGSKMDADDSGENNSSARPEDVLYELVTPRDVQMHSISSNTSAGSLKMSSLASTELVTGDIFITFGGARSSLGKGINNSTSDIQETSKIRLDMLTRYFRYLLQHVWVHFLPLTAQDAGFLTHSQLHNMNGHTDENSNLQSRRNKKKIKPNPGMSMALHPDTSVITLLKSLHRKFVRADLIEHISQIRFTKANCSVSSMPSFCINPSASFSALDGRFLPFIIPPLPMNHPVDFHHPQTMSAMRSSKEADDRAQMAQCTDSVNSKKSSEEKGFNVRWLITNENDAMSLGNMRKKVRHHYVYFDFLKGCDWTEVTSDVANLESNFPPIPILFIGGADVYGLPFFSNSMYLPMVNITLNLKLHDRAHDLLRSFLTEAKKINASVMSDNDKAKGGGCLKDPPSMDSWKSYLPLLLLVKKNRIVRLLSYNEIIHSVYPYNSLLELPRGQVRSDPTRPGSSIGASSQRKKSRSQRTRPNHSINLKWNAEARQGCVDIGSTIVGSLVVDFLPLDAFFNEQGKKVTTRPITDSISHVRESIQYQNESFFSTFPLTVPIQVIFYLDDYGKDLNLRYIPLLTFLRKQDTVMTFRKRIYQRLQNRNSELGVEAKRSNQNDKEKACEETNCIGSPLNWRLSLLSFQGQIMEDVKTESCEEHSGGESDVCGSADFQKTLWYKLKDLWPLAFKRRGGMKRMLRYLYKGEDSSDNQCIDDFKCFGADSDLPSVGMAIPLKAFEDLVRCRAGHAVGSAHCFRFDQTTGKLHKSIAIPANEDGSDDLKKAAEHRKNTSSEGIVIRG